MLVCNGGGGGAKRMEQRVGCPNSKTESRPFLRIIFLFFLTNEKRPSPSHTTNLAFIDFIHERKNFPISEKKRENISFENQFKIEKKKSRTNQGKNTSHREQRPEGGAWGVERGEKIEMSNNQIWSLLNEQKNE